MEIGRKLGRTCARIGAAAVVCAVGGMAAKAAPLPVVNPSFELPQTDFAVPTADGWTISVESETGVAGVFSNNTTIGFPPAHFTNHDGTQLGLISSGTGNEMSQLLEATYQEGLSYTLSVGVAKSFNQPPAATDGLRLALFYHGPGGQRELLADELVINDAATDLQANLLKFFEVATGPLPAGHPAIGAQVGVLIAAEGSGAGFFDFDRVTVEAVPEPASAAFVAGAAGAGMLLARRRRRRHRGRHAAGGGSAAASSRGIAEVGR